MKLFVQGNYQGLLPNQGGSVQLLARDGQLVSELNYEGTVNTLQETLRISEVMYHPLEASAAELAIDNTLISEDFEFVEILNVSQTSTIDLSDARFVAGIEFDFSGAAGHATGSRRASACRAKSGRLYDPLWFGDVRPDCGCVRK